LGRICHKTDDIQKTQHIFCSKALDDGSTKPSLVVSHKTYQNQGICYVTIIGGGTGGRMGLGSHFYFWGGLATDFEMSNFA